MASSAIKGRGVEGRPKLPRRPRIRAPVRRGDDRSDISKRKELPVRHFWGHRPDREGRAAWPAVRRGLPPRPPVGGGPRVERQDGVKSGRTAGDAPLTGREATSRSTPGPAPWPQIQKPQPERRRSTAKVERGPRPSVKREWAESPRAVQGARAGAPPARGELACKPQAAPTATPTGKGVLYKSHAERRYAKAVREAEALLAELPAPVVDAMVGGDAARRQVPDAGTREGILREGPEWGQLTPPLHHSGPLTPHPGQLTPGRPSPPRGLTSPPGDPHPGTD